MLGNINQCLISLCAVRSHEEENTYPRSRILLFFYSFRWRNILEIRNKLDLNKMKTDISFHFKLFCVSGFPFL